MTIITNRYTLGLILSALFAAFIYIGYLELKPDDRIAVVETGGDTIVEELAFLKTDNNIDGIGFFVEYRLERDRTRSKQIDLLQQIVENPNSVAETRQEAQQKLLQITNFLEQELQLEHLIMAKGFADSVIFIQPQSVTVVINQREFTQIEITKIADLVTKVTSQSMNNIYVIPKSHNN